MDPLGNRSPAQVETFTVDTTPPAVDLLAVPEAVPGDSLTITFATDDGPEGSGVAENECRWAPALPTGRSGHALRLLLPLLMLPLLLLAVVSPTSTLDLEYLQAAARWWRTSWPGWAAQLSTAVLSHAMTGSMKAPARRLQPLLLVESDLARLGIGLPWQNCTSPLGFADLPPGQYGFTLRASDYAGNSMQSRHASPAGAGRLSHEARGRRRRTLPLSDRRLLHMRLCVSRCPALLSSWDKPPDKYSNGRLCGVSFW